MKNAKKGRRYTVEEREDAVKFITAHNSRYRRGGLSRASKELGISQVTLRNWLQNDAITVDTSLSEEAGMLRQLALLSDEISALRIDIKAKELEYEQLKRRVF